MATRQARRGFTLIELMVVVSIIAVLAALLLPGIGVVRNSSYKQQARQTCALLANAAAAYRLEDGRRLLPDEDPTQHGLILYQPEATSPTSYGLLNHLESRGYLVHPADLRLATAEELALAGMPAALASGSPRVLVDRWRRPMRYVLDCWHATRPAALREAAPPAAADGNAAAATRSLLGGTAYIPVAALDTWNTGRERPFTYFFSAGQIRTDTDHLAANAARWIHANEGK